MKPQPAGPCPKRHKYTKEEYRQAFDTAFDDSPGVTSIAAGLLILLGLAAGGLKKEEDDRG